MNRLSLRLRSVLGVALFASSFVAWHFFSGRDAEAQQAQPKQAVKAGDTFEKVVAPFVAKHCVACHGAQKKKGNLTLHTFKSDKDVLKDRKVWVNVLQMLGAGEMPPQERPQPTIE